MYRVCSLPASVHPQTLFLVSVETFLLHLARGFQEVLDGEGPPIEAFQYINEALTLLGSPDFFFILLLLSISSIACMYYCLVSE